MSARLGFLTILVCSVACGNHHGSGDDLSSATLSIDPPTSTLLIANGSPATEDFTATLTMPDGTKQDVTTETSFAIDGEYGTFAAAKLTATVAGKVSVFASYKEKTANAEVVITLKNIRLGDGVPANAPDLFNGTDNPSRAPQLVYPPANVIVPRNLGDFEVHWTDASTNDLFEVSLQTEYADVRAYVRGGNGQAGAGPDPSYMAFLASEWAASVGGDTMVTLDVRGVDSTNPVEVGTAPPQRTYLSNETMNGGLYYWASAGSEPEGIYRHDMSKPGQPAEAYLTTTELSGTSHRCVACHVLSRDGARMMITYDGGDHAATTVDVASRTSRAVPTGASCSDSSQCGTGMGCVDGTCNTAWNFAAFTPDGQQLLTVYHGQLVVRDYASESVLATMTSAGAVTHPDLSADGSKLVYVRPRVAGSDWAFGTGDLYVRTYNAASMTFGPERSLVADGANNYYPSFSPDGQWVLYNKGDNTQNGALNQSGSYNGPNASLWVVKADGSAPPVALATANAVLGLTNSWGRWAPFAQTYGANDEPMFWVTVSSKRDFGVRLVQKAKPQIWMTPFFPERAAAGADPSSASFRLPFQDIGTNNHIAQWTEQVVVTQ